MLIYWSWCLDCRCYWNSNEQLVLLFCRAMLFCSLTNQLIKKRHSAVQEHLKGKKFMRAKGKKPAIETHSGTVFAILFKERLGDATQVNHLSDLILSCNPWQCWSHPLCEWQPPLCIINMLPHFCFFCSYMNCYWFWNILSLQFVEKFQNDEIELFEEPTIEEMVRWVLLTKKGELWNIESSNVHSISNIFIHVRVWYNTEKCEATGLSERCRKLQ